MRRIQRVILPKVAQSYLSKRQLAANEKHKNGDLSIERDWKSARQTKPLKAVVATLQTMMGPRHCHTHIVPRLQKVIDGQDPGGFRYYELAPTLLSTDRWGNLVINPEYDAAMLSAAMCKLEGFTYAPSETLWWQQGRSSECDFIYVTTQTMGPEQLEALSREVGTDPNDPRSLLVCCGAYRGVTAAQAAQRWPNLTLKKIPKMVRDRCEWGHDDYSLNVANLPMAQKVAEVLPPQVDLFAGDTA